jgi:hypothetical protein
MWDNPYGYGHQFIWLDEYDDDLFYKFSDTSAICMTRWENRTYNE